MDYIYIVIDIFKENFYGQLIWLLAFLVSIYNFLFCKDRKFIIFTAIASLIWGIHFYSIWLIAAALVNIIDILKNMLALKYKKSKNIAILFVLFYIIIWFITFKSYVDIIPTLTAIISTYLVFYVRWIWLNIGFMGVIILWGIYNILWHSIWWLATDITLSITWVIWIIRIIYSEKKDMKKEKH
jgi:hypothetical protein